MNQEKNMNEGIVPMKKEEIVPLNTKLFEELTLEELEERAELVNVCVYYSPR